MFAILFSYPIFIKMSNIFVPVTLFIVMPYLIELIVAFASLSIVPCIECLFFKIKLCGKLTTPTLLM